MFLIILEILKNGNESVCERGTLLAKNVQLREKNMKGNLSKSLELPFTCNTPSLEKIK